MNIQRALLTTALASLLVTGASAARAGGALGMEWWFGAGVNRPDYNDRYIAVGRAGAGVTVLERFSLGVNVQADRDRWFRFGYAGVVLPAIGLVEPYGRFHYGRRDDIDDDFMQVTGGLRYGVDEVKLFLEVFGIIEPGYGTGVCFGVTF
ncbi:MAG: hypothetical protein OEX18_09645 [Candidatus Krumholzibacteria bacterium]|nr:hypothetical protein [Candidatus Krumholzibacteria bacterium]